MLIDFTVYDKNGNYVPQRGVKAVFPKGGSAFGSMKDLIRSGLEEDAEIEGRRNRDLNKIVDEIQRTLPKTEAEISEEQVAQADRDLEAEAKYSIRGAFYKEFDAWDGKHTNVQFVVGTTSDTLKSIGMKDQEIKMHSGMILSKINKHPEITRDMFRQVPELLEHPIIIQFSDAIDPATKKPKYDDSITVLGELFAKVKENGKEVNKPVLVAINLIPTKKNSSVILNFAVVKSAYTKEALQQYLNENSILYVDPDKKRTDSWLSRTRLSLPVGERRYGPIRKIAYANGKVKVQSPKSMSEMQRKLYEAGIIDEFGNAISAKTSDGMNSLRNQHPTTRDILTQVDLSTRSKVEQYHLGKYQEQLELLEDLEIRLEAANEKVDAVPADEKSRRKERLALLQEARTLKAEVNRLKRLTRAAEQSDMMRKIVAEEKRKAQKEEAKKNTSIYDRLFSSTVIYTTTSRPLFSSSSVTSIFTTSRSSMAMSAPKALLWGSVVWAAQRA